MAVTATVSRVAGPRPRRIAYLTSRFPHVSETWIVREIDGVASTGDFEISLMSLFPPVDPTVHPAAEPWLAVLRQGSAPDAVRGVLYWLVRSPLGLLGSLPPIVWAFRRRPRLLARSLVTWAIAAGQARVVRERDIEHLHAHYATYPALAAWVMGRLTGVPYSFTAHAHDIYLDQSFLAHLVPDAEFVCAISEFNVRFLSRFDPTQRTPLYVVHMGVDPDRYAFRPRTPPRAGTVRVACVASLLEYKGHRVLFQALAAGRGGSLDRVELDLAGRGKLREELVSLAHALGIGERVHFHGALTEPRVAELLDRAHLFVLPSIIVKRSGWMEGIPVSLMEAMAVGLPVVTTQTSGVAELVRDRQTGLLAEESDPSSLAAVLARAVDEPEHDVRQRLKAARALVEAEFDARTCARRMAELLGAPSDRPIAEPTDP
ncbi:MAG: glycosyltransferase [Solirubrobacteraceae bacterium]